MDTNPTPRWESTEWLTNTLRRGGVIGPDVRVGSVKNEVLTGGFMADTLALQFEYENAAGGEPASMVGKFPSSNPDSRMAGKEMNAYEREVNFYKFFANDLSMRVPRCYFAATQVVAAASNSTSSAWMTTSMTCCRWSVRARRKRSLLVTRWAVQSSNSRCNGMVSSLRGLFC